ncbi:hypothetical protein A9F13_06g03509 [Clavispora lusitaniae]|uniref:Uncharacterized protein n=1 Tax=Clavispora lusitaniae TaxID=36911 RepID=A0AA91Q0Q3_CLALS|nr:hypothetical protein A9F13_06g03509 [Clavispora lusitaniae]
MEHFSWNFTYLEPSLILSIRSEKISNEGMVSIEKISPATGMTEGSHAGRAKRETWHVRV